MKTFASFATFVFCLTILCAPQLSADEAEKKPAPLQVGKRAPVTGVRFAHGEWAKDHTMTCPAAHKGKEPKIAIYTTNLNDNILNLGKAVDKLIENDPTLKWSFISVSDEKWGSSNVKSPRYYTKEELATRLQQLKAAAVKKDIKHLTVGLSHNRVEKTTKMLGIPEAADTMVLFLNGNRYESRRIKFIKPLHSSQLDAEQIEKLLAEIKKVRTRKK